MKKNHSSGRDTSEFWVCPNCDSKNNGSTCSVCGARRYVKKRKKSRRLTFLCVVLVLLAAVASGVYVYETMYAFSREWSTNESFHWHDSNTPDRDLASGLGEHTWDILSEEPATDLQNGTRVRICTVCGLIQEDTLPATAHIFDQQIVSPEYLMTPATCSEEAVYYYSCACGEKGEATFSAGGTAPHTYSEEWSSSADHHWHAATCGHNDMPIDFGEHIWDEGVIHEDTGVTTFTCTVCGAAKTEALMQAAEEIPAEPSTDSDPAEPAEASVQTALLNAQVGDYVTFGAYEQDNNLNNGKEAIEWLVLERTGDRLLLISRYALDAHPYHTTYSNVTWETCSLRTWLNNDFLAGSFTDAEQALIGLTHVRADKNPEYDTDPGNATIDRVFLLSIPEAESYFSSDTARMCAPTDYAKAQGVPFNDNQTLDSGEAACWWWLRSPGNTSDNAACVHNDGTIRCSGNDILQSYAAVRPALWIYLDA